MSTHYCHECAITLGHLRPLEPATNLTGSINTLKKYFKHTVPPASGSVISVFDQPDYDAYKDYVVTTLASGSVEVDSSGRYNILWVAGKQTGFTFINGVAQGPTDAVKVVLHTNPESIHAFPTGSVEFISATCARCGNPIVR
jgi:hypothetical protein